MVGWPRHISRLDYCPLSFPSLESIDSLAILLLGAIGDGVCLTSSLRWIKEHFPDKKIYLITEPPLEEFMPRQIITDIFIPQEGKLQEGDLPKLQDWLEANKVKLLVNLHSTFRSALVAFALHREEVCQVFGLMCDGEKAWVQGNVWHDFFHRIFYPKFLDEYMLNWTIIGRSAMMGLCLGARGVAEPVVSVSEKVDAPWKELDYIVFVPDANAPARRWPKEYFINLAEKILDKYDLWIVFLGREKFFVPPRDRLINLLGQTSLSQAIDIVARAKCVISNDTGMIHVAGAFSVPTIIICGPNNVGPEAKGRFLSIRKKRPCSPCRNAFCEDLSCMRLLSPEEVFNIFVKFWEGRVSELANLDSLSIGYSFEQELNVFFDYYPLSVPYIQEDLCFSVMLRWLLMRTWMEETELSMFELSDLKDYLKKWFSEVAIRSSLKRLQVVAQQCRIYLDNLLPAQEKIGILIKKQFHGAQKVADAINRIISSLPKELVFPWIYWAIDSQRLRCHYECITFISKRIEILIGTIEAFIKDVGLGS